jgi:2'-5' RNA ligase
VEEKPPRKLRLFFGIMPDKSCTQALRKSLSRLPPVHARPVPQVNHHITLVFLGSIDEDRIPCIKEQANKVSFRPFSFLLDTLGRFKRARVLWMGASEVPRAMSRLQSDLAEALKDCNFTPEERKYHPHLTLYRKFNADVPDVSLKPVRWEVRAFHLMISESTDEGVRYRSLATFPAR